MSIKYDRNFALEELGVITPEDSNGKTINTTEYIKDKVLTLF
ncbi:MAG: hypothetical protein SOZ34_04825 [Clostridia bacterium]|nr:hypothetical protein [Clostridia bacterium]